MHLRKVDLMHNILLVAVQLCSEAVVWRSSGK